jgi:hypothetical protein
MTDDRATNATIIGRLLEELLRGQPCPPLPARRTRHGERPDCGGPTPVEFPPRTHFLAEVLLAAHGATKALRRVADQIEDCELLVLPQELSLQPTGDRGPA